MVSMPPLRERSSSSSINHQEDKNFSTCSRTLCPKHEEKCNLIWFSVFYGCPGLSSRSFNHVRFDARVPDDSCQRHGHQSIDDVSPITPLSSRKKRHQRALEKKTAEELAIFHAVFKLAIEHEDEILARQKHGCVFCHMPAQSLVHRPICVTQKGYLDRSDFTRLYKLIMSIASHASGTERNTDKDCATGNFQNDRPYLCSLAVPICRPRSECHDLVAENLQQYVDILLENQLEPTILREDLEHRLADIWKRSKNDSHDIGQDHRASEKEVKRYTKSPQCQILLQKKQECEITTTIFVGRPHIRIVDPPPRGSLNCFVFSSIWPEGILPSPLRNKAVQAIDCGRVLASHEKNILLSAEYRCAICSELVRARCLFHHPISFSVYWESEAIRKAVMAIFQFVEGRWTFPETEAVFGMNRKAHIFDFAVPICAKGTICEEVSRTAAREFMKLIFPETQQMLFPRLEPDTDLSSLRDELAWANKEPQLLVQKVGSMGLMSEEADRGENPEDDTLTVTKLRRWHEMCFSQELVKRQFLREHGYQRTGDHEDLETDEIDGDSEIWITPQADCMGGSVIPKKPFISTDLPYDGNEKAIAQNRPLPVLPTVDSQRDIVLQKRDTSLRATTNLLSDFDDERHNDKSLDDTNDDYDHDDITASQSNKKGAIYDLLGLAM